MNRLFLSIILGVLFVTSGVYCLYIGKTLLGILLVCYLPVVYIIMKGLEGVVKFLEGLTNDLENTVKKLEDRI